MGTCKLRNRLQPLQSPTLWSPAKTLLQRLLQTSRCTRGSRVANVTVQVQALQVHGVSRRHRCCQRREMYILEQT